ncbi:MAG: hypothetical protein JXR80_08695, partial [Deltaproteobacteria bacterium]|nr:hypothetical protein [Deltaproteobacteria bacterium]
MKKTWLLINHNLLALLLAGLLLSCTNLPRPKPEFSPRPPACWLLQPVTYRLRHSAQLEYRGKKEMLEGFMELDLKEDRAHLIIFTSFGLT